MVSTKLDPAVAAHQEWIGFVGQTGLVVSASALVRAGAILDRRDVEGQRLLNGCVEEHTFDPQEGPIPHLPDFQTFAQSVLGWTFSSKGYAGTPENPTPPELELPLPDYGETLRPDLAVREPDPQGDEPAWQLLVRILEPGEHFDRVVHGGGGLESSAHGRMERLLRHTRVPAGVLFNGTSLRLVSAPRGESSGWLDFKVADMIQTAGRPISTALRLLLSQSRLLSLPRAQRLSALLEDSRKFQNEVSERLAQQVLHALYELLRGFQSAHDNSKGELLREPLGEHPDEIYRGLLTVILRLVFLLYAEERDMFPKDDTFQRFYSLAGLHERLREDAALFPDTMDQRFGAWAQLLVLFRMINDGIEVDDVRLPERHGVLFDPDRFPFLEGRPAAGARQILTLLEPPLVPDGTIFRALEKLLVLDGERISYRALDVEQIGSVYETMMGFRLETASGRSVVIKAQEKFGAPTAVDIEALLDQSPGKREKWIRDRADRKLTDKVEKATQAASTVEELHAALLPVVDPFATPDLVRKGAMVLQPSEERRRSGSHYTPRSLTEPIVRTTLEPILNRLRVADGRVPEPAQILELKVCDPAMGSGAFLVEACRQLGDALVEAWHAHGEVPAIPPDEDEVIFARRLIAQRCLYGVDRNPVAVDLAKMSLWLVTLAREHSLSFLNHALRHGDSLVGLSQKQIEAFHWDPDASAFKNGFESMCIREHVSKAGELRQRIREADDSVTDWELRTLWDEAQFELGKIRLFGDLALAAYFEGSSAKERESKRLTYSDLVATGEADVHRGRLEEWRNLEDPFAPFHWTIEFPEVFERSNPGFDGLVGNPPFLGGKQIPMRLSPTYSDCLKTLFSSSKGAADLAAYFFRRGFDVLRAHGCLGLLATKSIAETATRGVGLDPILREGGVIYDAVTNFEWPGEASVTVSRIHISLGDPSVPKTLNGKPVSRITSSLTAGLDFSKAGRLIHGVRYSEGTKLFGDAFIMEQAQVRTLIERNHGLEPYLRTFVNGDVLNGTPDADDGRRVVDFGELERSEISGCDEFLEFLAAAVSQERQNQTRQIHEHRPWLHWDKRTKFFTEARKRNRILACTNVSRFPAFLFVDPEKLFTHAIKLFDDDRGRLLALLQSRIHGVWIEATSSRLGNTVRYSTSTSFDTFPFPPALDELDGIGDEYDMFRRQLMRASSMGTTTLYSRFHDPDEIDSDMTSLRRLHTSMDSAVLGAYGWNDLPTDCDFFLEHEVDEKKWGSRKKPWRYRWPSEVRDEVLKRLLSLNMQLVEEEAPSGSKAAVRRSKQVARKDEQGSEVLF